MNGIRKQGMVVAAAIVGLAIVVSQGSSSSATAAGRGCGEDGSGAGFGRGQRSEARGPQLPSFGELAAVLRLTDDQRVVVEPAVERLQDDMDQFRGRGRGQRGPEHGAWTGAGDLDRPLHDFLGTVVPALDVEQVEALSDYLVARRDAQREKRSGAGRRGPRGGREGRGMSAGFGPGAGAWLGGELRHLGSELDLDDDQRDGIHVLLEERRDEFRAVHEGLESGDLSAEQVRDQAKALRRSVEEELGEILSPEQSSRLAELRAERRTEMAQRREQRADGRVERRAEFLAMTLELDDATAATVRDALESSEAAQRDVHAQLRDGKIEIEDALYRGHVIGQETQAEIAGALDAEQARVFAALHRLLPGGGRRGR